MLMTIITSIFFSIQVSRLPVTTAQLMGWYITRPNAKRLEIYGNNARGHVGFLKLLNWPAQGVE